jgi:hypothetical protein
MQSRSIARRAVNWFLDSADEILSSGQKGDKTQ